MKLTPVLQICPFLSYCARLSTKLGEIENFFKTFFLLLSKLFFVRMAQQGFVVSVATPWKREDGNVESLFRMCRERNEVLARKDPGLVTF